MLHLWARAKVVYVLLQLAFSRNVTGSMLLHGDTLELAQGNSFGRWFHRMVKILKDLTYA